MSVHAYTYVGYASALGSICSVSRQTGERRAGCSTKLISLWLSFVNLFNCVRTLININIGWVCTLELILMFSQVSKSKVAKIILSWCLYASLYTRIADYIGCNLYSVAQNKFNILYKGTRESWDFQVWSPGKPIYMLSGIKWQVPVIRNDLVTYRAII